MADTINMMFRCPGCGASFPMNVPAGQTVSILCPGCQKVTSAYIPVGGNTGGVAQPTCPAAAAQQPEKLNDHFVLKLVLLVAAFCAAGYFCSEAPSPGPILISTAIIVFLLVMTVKNHNKRKAQTQKLSEPVSNARTNAERGGTAPAAPAQAASAKPAAPAQPAGEVSYGRYDSLIRSEDFQKDILPCLEDAQHIISNMLERDYESLTVVNMRDDPYDASLGFLCFEVRVYHPDDEPEFNPTADDIIEAKNALALASKTHSDEHAKQYQAAEKQFLIDLFGEGYQRRGLIFDPEKGEWDGENGCFIFKRSLSTVSVYDAAKRKKYIKAAKYYWEKNNMGRYMSFWL